MYYKNIFLKGPQATIGYEDENLPTRVIIDISDLTKYGTGTTVLEVKRPCDREAYIAEQTEVDGNNFYWYPTKGDLEVSGLLKCQVKAVIGDQIVKTRVYFVQVSGALNGDGTLSGVVPDALQTFVESASGSEDAAKASAEEAKKAEEAAKASETAAKKSETNAKASETAAKASETVAKKSETNAKASEIAAKASETSAAKSASDADASAQVASAATTSAKNAATSESNAKTYASNASDSAMSAALSAASIKASADQIAANKKALQTPTTVTDPTSKTVLLAGSQGIDYSKLADAIIAKYQGQTLAGKAQSVKSALDTVRSVQDQTIKTEDSSTPCSYSAGNFFVYDGKLYKASADFSSVTLTADNISTYAEAQTQTAINALNQSLLSGVRIVEHWKYRPAYEIPENGQLELDFSKYVRDSEHPYGDNFLIFANTRHYAFVLFGFISLVNHNMTSCRGIIEVGLSLSFTHNDDYSVQSIVIKNNSWNSVAGIKDVYILRLS